MLGCAGPGGGAGAGAAAGGLDDSAASPLGRTPSAKHTLLCSRVRIPAGGDAPKDGELAAPAERRRAHGAKRLDSSGGAKSADIPARTLVASLLEDPHGHHDGGGRRAQHAGGLGLLQRGDGGAVLRRVVGVGARVARERRRLARVSWGTRLKKKGKPVRGRERPAQGLPVSSRVGTSGGGGRGRGGAALTGGQSGAAGDADPGLLPLHVRQLALQAAARRAEDLRDSHSRSLPRTGPQIQAVKRRRGPNPPGTHGQRSPCHRPCSGASSW